MNSIFILFILLPFIVYSATITANESNDYLIGDAASGCSLRGAIINANADAVIDSNCPAGDGPDTIILTTDFTFTLGTRGDDTGRNGDLDINSHIVITSDSTLVRRTINANNLDRIFDVLNNNNEKSLTLEGLILINGNDNGFPGASVIGGAIRNPTTASVTIDNVEFTSNTIDLTSIFVGIEGSAAIYTKGNFSANNVIFNQNTVIGNIPTGSSLSGAVSIFTDYHTFINNFILTNNTINDSGPFATNIIATGGFGIFGKGGLYGDGIIKNNVGKNGAGAYISSISDELFLVLNGDIENNSGNIGGVFDHRSFEPLILDMNGFSIHDNSAILGGLVHGEIGHVIIEFFDEITNNVATNGGIGYGKDMDFLIQFGNSITNNIATNGGLLWVQDGDVIISEVNFISDNSAVVEGGVIYCNRQKNLNDDGVGIIIKNITELSNNQATQFNSIGGIISAYQANIQIINITDIVNNYAYQGAVVSQRNTPTTNSFSVYFNHINILSENEVDHPDGGGTLVYSEYSDVTFNDIYGEMANNLANNGDGGLIYADSASVIIQNSNCDIYNNFAFRGTIIAADGSSSCIFTNNSGDIYDNNGFFQGGLLYCGGNSGYCEFSNFIGDITNNECGNGCVIFSNGIGIINNIEGNIIGNHAHFDGGVIQADNITLSNINGEISSNLAERGSGGVCFSESSNLINIFDIKLIDSNEAAFNGGVAYTENGFINIDSVCLISNNFAENGTGSVAWASNSITVTLSTLSGNSADPLFSDIGSVSTTPFTNLFVSAQVIGYDSSSYIGEVIATGGAGEYTYLWSTGNTSSTTNINSPFVSVEVFDASYCTDSASISIPNPIADAGTNFEECPSNVFTLGGSPSGIVGTSTVSGDIMYEWSPFNLLIGGNSSVNLANPDAFISETSTFSLVVTDVATLQTASSSVTVSTFPVTVDSGPDVDLCIGNSAQIGGNPTAFTNTQLTLIYTWNPSVGLNNASSPNPIASPTSTTLYSVTVSAIECRTLQYSSTVLVNVIPRSTIDAKASPIEDENSVFICKGSNVVLGGNSTGNPGPIFYEWTPSAGLDLITSPHPTANPTITTEYTLTVYSEENCSSDFDTVTVIVNDLEADSGFDLINSGIIGGFPTASGGSSPYSFLWSPADGLSNVNLDNPFASPARSTSYQVSVTDANGCIQISDVVNVVVRNTLTAGFTSIEFSYINSIYGTLNEVKESLTNILASILSIPPLAIDIQTLNIVEVNTLPTDNYIANIVIYEFGRTGEQLVDDLMVLFGCTANILPCVVNPNNNEMQIIGWDYLEFIAPYESNENYFTNTLETLSYTTYTENTFSFTIQDDDVDFTSIFTSMLLDDDDDENLSDFISGNDDDDENGEFFFSSNEYLSNTFLSSLLVQETENSGNIITIVYGLLLFNIIILI